MRVDYLANHRSKIAEISKWCCDEWPWYYDNGDIKSAVTFHEKTAQLDSIPSALVALEGEVLAGTISIISDDMEIRAEFSPWLGCLYVDPKFRGCGLALQLIKEGEQLARKLKIKKIYSWTEVLDNLLESHGWSFLEAVQYRGRSVKIFSLDL